MPSKLTLGAPVCLQERGVEAGPKCDVQSEVWDAGPEAPPSWDYGATGLDQGQSRWIKVNQTSFMGRARMPSKLGAPACLQECGVETGPKCNFQVRGLGCRAGGRRSAFVGTTARQVWIRVNQGGSR